MDFWLIRSGCHLLSVPVSDLPVSLRSLPTMMMNPWEIWVRNAGRQRKLSSRRSKYGEPSNPCPWLDSSSSSVWVGIAKMVGTLQLIAGCWAHHPMDVIRHIYFYSGIMSGNQNGYLIACRTRLAEEWWWSWIWDWIWNSSACPLGLFDFVLVVVHQKGRSATDVPMIN